MQKLITIQPGMLADMTLPYPFHVFEDGRIDRQDFWRGKAARVVGFQVDRDVQRVNLFWSEVVKDPQLAVGMFVVTVDDKGGMASWGSAISHVEVTELDERYTVEGQGFIGSGETLEAAKKDFKHFGGVLSDGYTATYYLGNREPEVTVKKARAARA